MTHPYREVWFAAADGLRLYARDYGRAVNERTPILCLSGLTRNSRDFEDLAPRLAAQGRRVLAPDYRGRGRSAYAPDGTSYRPDVELADALTLLDTLGIHRVAVIGTSRGGIVAMLMAKLSAGRLAGVLLNDIGPVLEKAGLLRIRTYLGRVEPLADWAQAVTAVKRINPGFTGVDDAMWERFTRRVFKDTPVGPAPDYDPRLADLFPTSEQIETAGAPPLWDLFDLLLGKPVGVLRGETSDLLSAGTVAEMQRRLPDSITVTVPGRGHVPFLDEPEALAAIDEWLARAP